jgi:uncharacterized protein DUF2071
MRLETTVRDMIAATWYVPAERVARALPSGVEPALAEDGRALLSLVALRNTGARLDRWPVPTFSQLGVRTYVTIAGAPALFLLAVRVSAAGIGGAVFGMPLRPIRLSVRTGSVVGKGAGVRLRYRVVGKARAVPSAAGVPLGVHDVALLVSAGVRRLVSSHEQFAWQEAELLEPARIEPVLALGFDVGRPDSVLYAEATRFSLELPPKRIDA